MFSDPYTVITQAHIGEGMTVADFGAGVGFYALALARRVGEYGRVFAIDVQPDHLKKLANEASHAGIHNIEVLQSDLEEHKGSGLMSASVDRIIIANTLFQTDHPEKLAAEARRIIKHNGKVAVVDWKDSFNQIGPHADNIVPEGKSRELFEKEGFILEGAIEAGSHHYGMLFSLPKKPMPGEKEKHESHKAEGRKKPGFCGIHH